MKKVKMSKKILLLLSFIFLGIFILGCKSCIINNNENRVVVKKNSNEEKLKIKDINIIEKYYPISKGVDDDKKVSEFFKIISLTQSEKEIFKQFEKTAYGDYLNNFPGYNTLIGKYNDQKKDIEYLSIFLFENGFYSMIASRKLVNKYDFNEILKNFNTSYDLYFTGGDYLEKYPVIYKNKKIENLIKEKLSYFTKDKF